MSIELTVTQVALLIEAIEQYYHMVGFESEELDSLYEKLKEVPDV